MYYWLVILFPLIYPFIAKKIFGNELNIKEVLLNLIIATGLSTLILFTGSYFQTLDVEILNGEVIEKEKIKTSCEHTYPCNCDKNGCSICYEHWYDWDYVVKSNVGETKIDRVDRQGVKTPPRFNAVIIGESFAIHHKFTNYIKAASNSLFHEVAKNNEIPKYPNNIYDYYKVNRVIQTSTIINNIDEWNYKLSILLKELGPKKQINIIILITEIQDPNYFNEVKSGWIGGKKNDAIIVISVNNQKPTWVGVHSWSKNDLFNIELRDKILTHEALEVDSILSTIREVSLNNFERRPMKEFEYLKYSIDPPLWLVVFAGIIGVISSVGLSIYFSRKGINL